MSRAALNWSDPGAVKELLATLRVSLSDADAVSRDMLRPAHERELGPVLHAKNYGDAWQQVMHALDYAAGHEPGAADPVG
jgi:hypothetical protein